MSYRSCEVSVSTHRCHIAVCAYTWSVKYIPILEVTEFRCIYLVYYLTIEGDSVSASPQAVFGLYNKVHIGHLSLYLDRISLFGLFIKNAYNYNEIIAFCLNHHCVVEVCELFILNTGYRYTIPYRERFSQACGFNPNICCGNTYPHSTCSRILFKHIRHA